MSIAVIGTGSVGGTLGSRWARKGREVVFGSREPSGPKVMSVLDRAGPTARAASIEEAAAGAEIVVLATPWGAAREALDAAGDLRGRILVDCTNAVPVAGGPPPPSPSAGEQVMQWAPGARVVKAFNTTGAENMADPDYEGQAATMFLCGDDAEARQAVGELAAELGFDVVDAGSLRSARYLEAMALLWIHLAHTQGLGRDIAFKVLRR